MWLTLYSSRAAWATKGFLSASDVASPGTVWKPSGIRRWSWRFSPTFGLSMRTGIPWDFRRCLLPMPDSSRSCGD